MVRPEWVSRLIEFLYIVILKNAKNGRNIKYMTLIMFKLRPMKPLTSKYVKLMLTSLNLIHWLQRYANYCSRGPTCHVAQLSLWLISHCGPTPHVAQLSLRPNSPCGSSLPVDHLSMWYNYPCGSTLHVAQLSMWPISPCGPTLSAA